MNYPLVITEPNNLGRIVDAIHDYWFDLEKIQFESGTSTLQIPFSKSYRKGWKKFMFWKRDKHEFRGEFLLEIRHVMKHQINDTEKVGIYDFNEMQYDQKNKIIIITAGIPLGFLVYVSRLEVAVRELG